MKRRRLFSTFAGLTGVWSFSPSRAVDRTGNRTGGDDLESPYADVDWDRCEYLHSMSHQHQGQTDASRDLFRAMGYRHFAFSNYYPSAPTYPLPPDYLAAHPDVIGAPNAEQHSFPDASIHFNSLGSLLATGYGSSLSAAEQDAAPLRHRFEKLNVFDAARPWAGVYRLDVRLAAVGGSATSAPTALLTVEAANECDFRENFSDKGRIRERPLAAGNHTIHLRTLAAELGTVLTYDKTALKVTQFRLMQGANRPWRDMFRAALDGETVAGVRSGGLLHPDGGGITLNHPTGTLDDYAPMLDHDPRVLGIEVWNQLTSGFGSARGFYAEGRGPHLHFYRLWDEILKSGRRCWGFFVKDHNTYGRGRNVLVVPGLNDLSAEAREAAALHAYRHGCFFGSVGALAVNEAGKTVAPFDHSGFRFNRLVVRRDDSGLPVAIEVSVTGNDPAKRPQLQIRFVTDQGIASVVDAAEAGFPLKRDEAGRIEPLFVRIEAFAYPATHSKGQPLTAAAMREMNVHDISLLHDHLAKRGGNFFGGPHELRAPIPIVDMIFSQPLRRVQVSEK